MGIVVILVFSLLFIFALIFIIKGEFIIRKISRMNCIIFGAKGSGKDMLMQKIYNSLRTRRRKVYSNELFSSDGYQISMAELNCGQNTIDNMILNKIIPFHKNEKFENSTLMISDSGLYVPNYLDYELKKNYKGMPLYWALSRHMYNQNIIMNVQDIDRIWKLLEEQQQDCYVNTHGVYNLGLFLICRATFYSRLETAKSRQLPMRLRGLKNETNRALIEEQRAREGIIEDFIYIIPIWQIKYDTRSFHKKFFGKPAHYSRREKRRMKKEERRLKNALDR